MVSAALSGCQVFGFFAANLAPRPKIKAAYKPDDLPAVVFVDDPRQAVPSAQLRTLIAEKAGLELKEQGVIAEVIPAAKLEELRHSEEDFASWPIDKVGQRLGAKQVIYVLVDAFDTGGETDESRRPVASGRWKVIDVATGKRLFPERGEKGVASSLYFKHPPIDDASFGRETTIARKLAERLGEDLAKQFYDHEAREVGSGFED